MNKIEQLFANKAKLEEEIEAEHQKEVLRVQKIENEKRAKEYAILEAQQDEQSYWGLKEYSDLISESFKLDENVLIVISAILRNSKAVDPRTFRFLLQAARRHIDRTQETGDGENGKK